MHYVGKECLIKLYIDLYKYVYKYIFLIGQYAIECFTIVYKTGYIIGATVIACVAVTAALYIFFKVRGNWMNSWYRRLGCSMLMAFAVCGKLE